MTPNIARLRHRLGGSLGFGPALAAIIAIAGGLGLPAVDRHLDIEHPVWFLFDGGADSAREVLSTITASMITLTALVFSITVLVLQLASSQFSPRVIGSFLREKSTKWALSVFVGTFVFAMVVLAKVRSEPDEFVPGLSVWLAFVLVLLSTGVFIRYIDRMTQSVRAVTIIGRIARSTRQVMQSLYPTSPVQETERIGDLPQGDPDTVIEHDDPPGVLTAVDSGRLLALACEAEAVLELVPRLGDFVPSGGPLMRVWYAKELDEPALRRMISIEPERTIEQDPAFGFRQLVDIAVRALSPGVNDPTTAVQSLDHLHDLVRRLTTCCFPERCRTDSSGVPRLIVRTPTYVDYVRLAFEEIASCSHDSIQVRRRLQIAFEDCLAVAPPERREILQAERRRLGLE